MNFKSRRTCALGTKGMVACSQSLATAAGLEILRKGGSAADAAVAVTACLNVCEPTSTGIGGDAFCLYFDAAAKKVSAVRGGGRSPAALTLDLVRSRGHTGLEITPSTDALCAVVPGAPAAWEDVVARFGSGKLTLADVLAPAIELAESGPPIGPVTAQLWRAQEELLRAGGAACMLDAHGCAPRAGERKPNPELASTFRRLATHGAKKGFYSGPVAEAIVEAVQSRGGVLSLDDLAEHETTFPDPVATTFRDAVTVWELPPPNHGVAALLAMNMFEAFTQSSPAEDEVSRAHAAVEAMRVAFADAMEHCGDPDHADARRSEAENGTVSALVSKPYAKARAAFSLGYSCVRSESGWSNAHAIVGACGHASLFAVAFGESDDLDASRSAGWGPKEACAWALVQLLSVAKKRMSCKALVAQLRQLGVARACADAVLAPLPMLEAGQSKRRASSVGRAARAGDHLRAGSRDYATSDASRELGAQLLYLTSTGDPDYVDQVSACPLERLVSFACDFGHRSFDGKPDPRRRARHAAQFAVTHGLHLPQDDDRSASRKLSFARHVVDAAREAVNDAAAAKRCTAEARDRVAALALVADSCPDELVNVGAPRVCADVLRNADVLLPAATYGDAASDKALQAVAPRLLDERLEGLRVLVHGGGRARAHMRVATRRLAGQQNVCVASMTRHLCHDEAEPQLGLSLIHI